MDIKEEMNILKKLVVKTDTELLNMMEQTILDDNKFIVSHSPWYILVDVDNPSETRIEESLQDILTTEEWSVVFKELEQKERMERMEKERKKKRIGFGVLIVNQFSGDYHNILSMNERPEFVGIQTFTGQVKGQWLIDGCGKYHKVNAHQVVSFKFYATKEEFEKR